MLHPGLYDLGYDTKASRLVRLERRLDDSIPEGCVRIKKIALDTFDLEDVYMNVNKNLLRPIFWNLPRFHSMDF